MESAPETNGFIALRNEKKAKAHDSGIEKVPNSYFESCTGKDSGYFCETKQIKRAWENSYT